MREDKRRGNEKEVEEEERQEIFGGEKTKTCR